MGRTRDLDDKLRKALIDLLSSHPPLATYEGREVWLMNLPPDVKRLVPNRNRENIKYDLARIIHTFETRQFKDGGWVLLSLIDPVLEELKDLIDGQRLQELRHKIKKNLEDNRKVISEISISKPPATLDDLIEINQECARLFRDDELVKEIKKNLIGESDSIVIYGQPVVTGKTSILDRLFEELGDSYVPLIMTIQGGAFSNLNDFLYEIVSQLTTQFNTWANSKRLSVSLEDPVREDFTKGDGTAAFKIQWNHLREADKRQPVIMIDEIEYLLDLPEKNIQIFTFIKEFINKINNGYCILAGSEKVLYTDDEYFSPLVENRRPIHIRYLKEEAVKSFFSVVQNYFTFENDILKYIIALCDGHPIVLKNFYEAITFLTNRSQEKQKVERRDIECIVKNVIERIQDDVLSALWQRLSPSERYVVDLVSKKPVIFNPLDNFECNLKGLFVLADTYLAKPTPDLRKGIENLAKRELVEWKNKDEELFRFKLGILPLWLKNDFLESMKLKGRDQ